MTWNEFIKLCPRYTEIPEWGGFNQEVFESRPSTETMVEKDFMPFYGFKLWLIDLNKQKGPCNICGSEKTKPMHFIALNEIRNYCLKCYEKDVHKRDLDSDEPQDWFEYCEEEHKAYSEKKKAEREK
jgi:hypothetical protein